MKKIPLLFCLPFFLALGGCLSSTTQHLNTGRTLAPGVTEDTWTVSYGKMATCEGDLKRNADGYMVCRPDETKWDYDPTAKQYSLSSIPMVSTSWRLGVREKWGPLTGVDLGWALEIPGTLEFDGRFGLPVPGDHPKWRHNVALGWGIGNWADNTWYAEYASSWQASEKTLLFGNFRESWLSTQLAELEIVDIDEDEAEHVELLKSHRRFLHQLALGTKLGPTGMDWLPDYYTFALHLTAPVILYGGGEPYSLDAESFPWYNAQFSLGLIWN